MREIKFRGRDEQGRWHFGMLRVWRDQSFAIETTQGLAVDFVDPATVGQFTGLKDCEGHEIYEGDVVRCKHDDWAEEDAEIYAVRYFDDLDYPAFELDGWEDGESNGLSYFMVCGEIHVIGNIHDNPGFLKEGGGDARKSKR